MKDYIYGPQCDDIYKAIKLTNFIVVTGMASVGKTTMIKHILNEYSPNVRKEIVYSYVNCNIVATAIQFYNIIVENFNTNLQKDLQLMTKTIMGVRDFADIIENLIIQASRNQYKIVIALDSIEYLKKTPALECLNVLTNIKGLKLIIVTCESGSSIIENYFKFFNTKASLQNRLIEVEVPVWRMDDIIDNICKIKPQRSYELYKKFVNNVVRIFYYANTKDFVELRTFCMENFGKFLEHYEREFKIYVEKKEPHLVGMSADELEKEVVLEHRKENTIVSSFLASFKSMIKEKDLQEMTHLNIDRKIVLGTSILIIAAYIAANTKPSDDRKNFLKYQRRKERSTRYNKDEGTVMSAKYFTMERLIQIYRALSCISMEKFDDENSEPEHIPDSVLSDIKLLEDLKILTIASGDGFDTYTKYQLSKDLEREYVDRLGKQVSINLDDFHGL